MALDVEVDADVGEHARRSIRSRYTDWLCNRASPTLVVGESAALAVFERLPIWLGLALALALQLVFQPYRGVRHDSLLYTGQALSHLDPSWAAKDMFFVYGSQDQFTLYSGLLATLIARFGIANSDLMVLMVGHVASLIGIWWLTRDLSAARRWFAVLAVAGTQHFFGAGRIFSVLEPFATARTLAEPLAILALAALIRGRLALACAGLFLSVLLHPLVAIPAVVVTWCYLVAGNRRWLCALGLALPLAGLVWGNVAPFNRLAHVYDAKWLEAVLELNSQVFISTWNLAEAVAALSPIMLTWVAVRGNRTTLARLSRAATISAGILCVISFVGADVFKNQLITQLQLWRGLWITSLLFVVWLPSLIVEEWRAGALARLAAVSLLFAAPAMLAGTPNAWVFLFWAIVLLGLRRLRIVISQSILRLVGGVTALICVATCAMTILGANYQAVMHLTGAAMTSAWSTPFMLGSLTIPCTALLLAAACREGKGAYIAIGSVVVALFAAVWQFDQRTPLARYVESSQGRGMEFSGLIPRDAQVYWEDMQTAPVWFMLRRPNFLGAVQFSGLLFNRETALLAMKRMPLFAPIANQLDLCTRLEGLVQDSRNRYQDCELPEKNFLDICRGEDHADFIVSHLNYAHPPLAQWRFDPKDGSPAVTYYLHDCKTVR